MWGFVSVGVWEYGMGPCLVVAERSPAETQHPHTPTPPKAQTQTPAMSRPALLAVLLTAGLAAAEESYPVPEDAQPRDSVPAGEVAGPFEFRSNVFPGTVRQYWVYVPAAYDADKPACLCVVQDGLNKARQYRIPAVFDNLIAEGAMPVTLGLFVTPGVVPVEGDAQPRFNRSFEYDSMGGRYAKFLIDELIPEVEKTYAISEDPNDRMICGSSSGGVCAWTAAWERPDAFRRVFSSVGTFVDLRGADAYPAMIRKHEPKPIRVFLQDGSNDLDIYAGNWFDMNRAMLSSLQWSGYDVKHVWGEGGHNTKHAAYVFPEAVRWLWRDYPEPVTAGHAANRRMDILIEGEDWELVSGGHTFVDGPAVNADGEVFFPDVRTGEIFRVGLDGTVSTFVEDGGRCSGLMFGAEGDLHGCQIGEKAVVRFDADGKATTLVADTTVNDLTIRGADVYYTDPRNKTVWLVREDGGRVPATQQVPGCNGIALTADQRFAWVSDGRDRAVWHFRIAKDGTFSDGAPVGYLHLGPASQNSGGDGMTVDADGYAYVGTPIGVQVMDQLGRVHVILDSPNGAKVTNVCFGGPDLNVLYAAAGSGLYRRKLNATGVVPLRGPVTPPKPGL